MGDEILEREAEIAGVADALTRTETGRGSAPLPITENRRVAAKQRCSPLRQRLRH
jgi:hypothetical protein